jgi:serine/threonine-protein kinase 24/25/MST4
VVHFRYHKITHETVAIKVIDLDYAEDDVDDIMKEIAILAQMNSKYVTRYEDDGHADGRYFGSYIKGSQLWIVMEFCGGASCADMVSQRCAKLTKMKPDFIPEGYIAIILREVLLGMTYLHSEGKIHRDIKGNTSQVD